MTNPVRSLVLTLTAIVLLVGSAWAADMHYVVQVDGLNCPFCAYGIEKQLSKLDGVENVETELVLGQIYVEVVDGVTLSEETVRAIIRDAGFTFKRMTHHQDPQAERGDSQ